MGIANLETTRDLIVESSRDDCALILSADDQQSSKPTVDKYYLSSILGRGGSGTVWKAEQLEPVKRPVAIKFLREELSTPSQIARFENEQQTLAHLNHPQIAKALDCGWSSQGVPYLVMELIDGIPITEFCDNGRYTIRMRLELIRKVFAAVEHAHQKGIIHRDLKPTNVLVAIQDDHPSPKVIDFGLAKALSPLDTPSDKADRATLPGTVLGTPAYMSPEQIDGGGSDLDTRTDVYALGAMLYELVSGEVPFAPRPNRPSDWRETFQRIRHEEPLRPSRRLANSNAFVVDARSANASTLVRETRGEIDWIILKALAKAPNDRYESVAAMRRDVECLLSHRPIDAHPPSVAYQISKFVRRHCLATCAATLIASALLIGFTGLAWGLQRAQEAEANASMALISEQKESRRARLALTAFADLISNGCVTERNTEDELLRQVTTLHDIASAPHGHTYTPSESGISVADASKRNAETLRQVLQILGHLRREQPTLTGEIVEVRVRHRLARTLAASGESEQAANEFQLCVTQLQVLCTLNPCNAGLAQQLDCMRLKLSELRDSAGLCMPKVY